MTGERSPAAAYDQLAPAVFGYFRSHRAPDPEALTGDVFVAVTERLAGFRGDDAALRRWVFTIAHHKMVDEVVVLRHVADLPVADVARITGRRAGAVKMLQARALEALLRDLSGSTDDHNGDGPRRPDRSATGTG